jgi:hypothetical protein
VVIPVLYKLLEFGALLTKTWMAFNTIEFRKI